MVYFYYIFVLAIVYNGIVPCVEYLWNQGNIVLSGNIKASWVVSYIVLYPCLGYFMHYRLDRKRIRKMLPVVWAADILSIAVSCYITYYKGVITGVLNENESQGFFGIFVVVNCVAIFITTKYLWEESEIPLWLRKIIVSVGGCTFGVYLIHAKLVGSGLFIRGIEFLRNVGINQMLAAWILCFVVLAVSYMVTFVLSKIPVVRKVVGF